MRNAQSIPHKPASLHSNLAQVREARACRERTSVMAYELGRASYVRVGAGVMQEVWEEGVAKPELDKKQLELQASGASVTT